jgi:hypothetical protein
MIHNDVTGDEKEKAVNTEVLTAFNPNSVPKVLNRLRICKK